MPTRWGSGTLSLNGSTGNLLFNVGSSPTISNAIVVNGTMGAYLLQNVTTSGALTGAGILDNTVGNGGASWNITGDLSGFQGTFKYLAGTNNQNNVNIAGATNASMDMSHAKLVISGATSGGARALDLGGTGPGGDVLSGRPVRHRPGEG